MAKVSTFSFRKAKEIKNSIQLKMNDFEFGFILSMLLSSQ